MATSNSAGSRGRISSNGSAGSRNSKTPPNSAGKISDTTRGIGAKSKPSDRLNPKTVDHFSSSSAKGQTAFASVYINGGIPCRLVHGSVKHKLAWDSTPENVPFDPVLITLAEGLRETVHPYTLVSAMGFKELMESQNAGDKASPILPKVVPPLRAALLSKRMMDKNYRDRVTDTLQMLEKNGGKEVLPVIKAKVPTYSSIFG